MFDGVFHPADRILLNSLPLAGGWYGLRILGLEPEEVVEVRFDFGLGFVGHHGVRTRATAGTAELYVRLFKTVGAVQLLRAPTIEGDRSSPEMSFDRLTTRFVWQRRAAEQMNLFVKALRTKRAATPHDRPRRLWGWRGLQAFPTTLPATGESSLELWRRVVGPDATDELCASGVEPSQSPARGSWAGRTTVIIPTRNRADLLQRCVDSVLARTRPQPPEIIIHDNGSDEESARRLLEQYAARDGIRVIRDERPFNFSRINNEAAEVATGDILIFLNNDTEVLSEEWIDLLAQPAADPSVGCVGPLLLTPSGRIQHAGLVTGPGGIAAHLYAGSMPAEADPIVPIVRRHVSAVTGACLVIERSKFRAVGGFDAEHLPVAFNDVDLCLRLEREGLQNLFVPEAKLIHLGSATREDDDFTTGSDRFRSEFRVMRERWASRLDYDPHFPQHMRLLRLVPQLRLV